MTSRAIILLLALAMSGAAPARAETEPGPMPEPPGAAQLIRWVASNSPYPSLTSPGWYVVTDEQARIAALNLGYTSGPVASLYHCDTKTIYIAQMIAADLTNLDARATIVHELVHHGQCSSGIDLRWRVNLCTIEGEATAAEIAYLKSEPPSARRDELLASAEAHGQAACDLSRVPAPKF